MKIIKLILCSALVSCIVASSVFAASLQNVTIKLDSDERSITISGKIADMEKNQDVSLSAISKTDGLYYYAAQEYVNSDGTFSLKGYIQPNKPSAYLDIVVGGKGIENGIINTFYYADSKEKENALKAINSATTEAAMHSMLDTYGKRNIINADVTSAEYLSQSSAVDNIMANTVKKESFKSIGEVNDAFQTALVMKSILGSQDIYAEIIFNSAKISFLNGLDYNISNIKDKLSAQKVINICISKETDNVRSFFEEYKTAYALIVLNNTAKSDIPDILLRYNSIFNLNLSGDYKKVSGLDVAKALYMQSYTSVNSLETDFNNAVGDLLNSGKDISLPKGGNRGGGGGSVSVTAPVMLQNEPSVTENNGSYKSFSDIGSALWAEEAIVSLAEKGVICGYEDGTLRPDNSVTRAEFLKMIITAFGINGDGDNVSFNDVEKSQWYYSYIKSAVFNGIVNGDNGNFKPNSNISREDAAVILYRVLKNSIDKDYPQAESFKDESEIADYAKEASLAMRNAGIITGFENGSFMPKQDLTRAQAAKIIHEALNGGSAK